MSRYLTIAGARAYDLGSRCDSEEFGFERLADPVKAYVTALKNDTLRKTQPLTARSIHGVAATRSYIESHQILRESLEGVLPAGGYRLLRRTLTPRSVVNGSEDDYFATERVAVWGARASMREPGVDYLRGLTMTLGPDSALFEFVVPFVSSSSSAARSVVLRAGDRFWGRPDFALAWSVLEVRRPFVLEEFQDAEGRPVDFEHWCLSHYLLDGHHRMEAASRAESPMNLVSFLSVDVSVAAAEHVEALVRLLQTNPEQVV